MAAPKTTTWELEPHTRAKHAILRRYLEAWTPILSLGGFPRFMYVDGFAGPGQYVGGHDGSPIIALKAALGQQNRIAASIDYFFIERDRDRADFLERLLPALNLPKRFEPAVFGGLSFERVFISEIRPRRGRQEQRTPLFAFLDPFGWTGIPFDIVSELASAPSAEVLVTFMYEEINRFLGHPDQPENLDSFFGTTEWRSALGLEGLARRKRLRDLYAAQLKRCARFVRTFEMRNERDSTDYYLFFATNSAKGLEKMKEAMWRVDSSGEFVFSDATNSDQHVLFASDHRELPELIAQQFAGRTVRVAEVAQFVLEETAYPRNFFKRALKSLETAPPPKMEPVDAPPGRRRGTFPDEGLSIRFPEIMHP
ncbi:MAG: three-Cys-motif partner protein TcmP [Planctomycetota bacterium]